MICIADASDMMAIKAIRDIEKCLNMNNTKYVYNILI